MNKQDVLLAGGGEIEPPALCPEAADPPIVQDRIWNRGRALRLAARLKIRTAIDETDRLRTNIEIVYESQGGGTILPITVRVGRQARDADVVANGGVLSLCRRYNSALARLHQLAARLAGLPNRDRLSFASDPGLASALRVLSQLDALIQRRQSRYMQHHVVLQATLTREIEFFSRFYDQLLGAAEAAAAGVSQLPEPRTTATPEHHVRVASDHDGVVAPTAVLTMTVAGNTEAL